MTPVEAPSGVSTEVRRVMRSTSNSALRAVSVADRVVEELKRLTPPAPRPDPADALPAPPTLPPLPPPVGRPGGPPRPPPGAGRYAFVPDEAPTPRVPVVPPPEPPAAPVPTRPGPPKR